jgi:aminoglycoside phosphotransferase (APT) family kinase protein
VHKRYADWARGEHEREWHVLRIVHAARPGLVPAPLAADLGATPPWIAMSRLPGTPLGGSLSGEQIAALGAALRALWSVPVADLPLRRFAPAEAWDIISRRFDAADRPGGIAGIAFDRAIAFLSGPRLPAGPASIVGHGDPNLANYLWDHGAVRIVDFEDAGRSDIAYELATLVEHVGARDTGWDAFLAGFDVDPARLRSSRALVASQWLLMLLPGGAAAGRNPPEVLDRQAERLLALLDL